MKLTRAERLSGGVLGLLVGDALGVPYEFHAPDQIPPADEIDFVPPAGFRSTHQVLPGTFSDDGAQALCLLASLLDRSGLDIDDLAQRLLAWRDRGYMAVDGRVFDCGVQTEHGPNYLTKRNSSSLAGHLRERGENPESCRQ